MAVKLTRDEAATIAASAAQIMLTLNSLPYEKGGMSHEEKQGLIPYLARLHDWQTSCHHAQNRQATEALISGLKKLVDFVTDPCYIEETDDTQS